MPSGLKEPKTICPLHDDDIFQKLFFYILSSKCYK